MDTDCVRILPLIAAIQGVIDYIGLDRSTCPTLALAT